MNFFLGIFPFIFFCFFPAPRPHHFSNGPSLSDLLGEYLSASFMQPGPGLHAVDFAFLVSETWIPVLIVNGIPDSKALEFQIPQAKTSRNLDCASENIPDAEFRILTRGETNCDQLLYCWMIGKSVCSYCLPGSTTSAT